MISWHGSEYKQYIIQLRNIIYLNIEIEPLVIYIEINIDIHIEYIDIQIL